MGGERFDELQGEIDDDFFGDELPMLGVTWDACRLFCEEASAEDDARFELPTEAQWEYACRANTEDAFAGAGSVRGSVWFDQKKPLGVGELSPNGFGLHDMLGNVFEWCLDDYEIGFYRTAQDAEQNVDPLCSTGGTVKVARGGCFKSREKSECRAAYRGGFPNGDYPVVGFRPVVVLR